jgi:sortase A
MTIAADRGGPFARAEGPPRNWMRAGAPGIAAFPASAKGRPERELRPLWGQRASATCERGGPHLPSSESSPIGSGNMIQKRPHWPAICITLLALAGALTFGHGAYMTAKAHLAQWLLHAAWDAARESGEAVKPWPWADTHPVARLMAPGHDADVLVLSGASGRTLAFGPGHLDGSALPGDPGNAVITAHRDTHFRFLRTVAPGDELVVERADGGRRHFRIRGTYVADHRDLWLPRDTPVPTLTLVTCYPFDAVNPGGPLRYVVVAEAA